MRELDRDRIANARARARSLFNIILTISIYSIEFIHFRIGTLCEHQSNKSAVKHLQCKTTNRRYNVLNKTFGSPTRRLTPNLHISQAFKWMTYGAFVALHFLHFLSFYWHFFLEFFERLTNEITQVNLNWPSSGKSTFKMARGKFLDDNQRLSKDVPNETEGADYN